VITVLQFVGIRHGSLLHEAFAIKKVKAMRWRGRKV